MIQQKEVLKSFRKLSFFWCLNISVQLIFIPLLVSLGLFGEDLFNISVILFGGVLVLSTFFFLINNSFCNKACALLDNYSKQEKLNLLEIQELKKYIKRTIIAFMPLFGLFSSAFAAKAYLIADLVRKKEDCLLKDWTKKNRRSLKSWGFIHVVNILLGNAFWGLLVFYENSEVIKAIVILSVFVLCLYIVSISINLVMIKHDKQHLKKLKDKDIDTLKRIKIWTTSIKWNFLAYVPVIGTFALIPYFIAREANNDMIGDSKVYEKQYIYKCKFFCHIVVWGSFVFLPFLISYLSLEWWKDKPWLITPIISWSITNFAINVCLACEKAIYSEMYLSETKHYSSIEEINTLSKVAASMSFLSLIASLPSIVILLKKLNRYIKKTNS